jgi:hypothetical protein
MNEHDKYRKKHMKLRLREIRELRKELLDESRDIRRRLMEYVE